MGSHINADTLFSMFDEALKSSWLKPLQNHTDDWEAFPRKLNIKNILFGDMYLFMVPKMFYRVRDIEAPSRVDGKRRYLAQVSDFVSWDEACRVPRHKITHECKIQYRHLIPAPVDQTSTSAWSYKHPWITCQKISQGHQRPMKLADESYVQL